jgi:glycosyltransferase involved in cell wall biosynthesis
MSQLLQGHDVLLIPSVWPEPFSRMVLEGMAAGLAVIATPTGGTTEVVRDGENGLLFAPGDSDALARQIARLGDEPELRQRLAQAGLDTISTHFTEARMLDEIEQYLREVVRSGAETRQ